MASIIPEAKQAYFDSTGKPLVGGKLFTYQAGTTTPKATYSNQAGTVPNTNPIILDARGEALIFWSGSYKVVLQDALGNTIWTVDNVVENAQTDLVTGSNGSLILPNGSIAQRDANPATGYLRYNSETGQLEMYYADGWATIQRALVSGTTLKTIAGQGLLGSGDVPLKTINGVALVGSGDIVVSVTTPPGANIYTANNFGAI